MMRARSTSLVALASSSAKNGQRCPVVASSRTMGASAASERPMSVIGAAPVAVRSAPGTLARISAPGLKPSLVFQSLGSMWTPATFAVIDARFRSTRRPVSVVGSRVVNQSFGNGSRHRLWPRKSQRDASVVSTAGSQETVADAYRRCAPCHAPRARATTRLMPGERSAAVSAAPRPRATGWSRVVTSTGAWPSATIATRSVERANGRSRRTITSRVPSRATWVRSPGATIVMPDGGPPSCPCGNQRPHPASTRARMPIPSSVPASFGPRIPIPPEPCELRRPYRDRSP